MNMKVIFCCSMPRFTSSLTGSICIDGLDIRGIQIESLRRNIGLVSQDTVSSSLFFSWQPCYDGFFCLNYFHILLILYLWFVAVVLLFKTFDAYAFHFYYLEDNWNISFNKSRFSSKEIAFCWTKSPIARFSHFRADAL